MSDLYLVTGQQATRELLLAASLLSDLSELLISEILTSRNSLVDDGMCYSKPLLTLSGVIESLNVATRNGAKVKLKVENRQRNIQRRQRSWNNETLCITFWLGGEERLKMFQLELLDNSCRISYFLFVVQQSLWVRSCQTDWEPGLSERIWF